MTAQRGRSGEEIAIAYAGLKVVGSGSFGVVCSARIQKGLTGQLPSTGLVCGFGGWSED